MAILCHPFLPQYILWVPALVLMYSLLMFPLSNASPQYYWQKSMFSSALAHLQAICKWEADTKSLQRKYLLPSAKSFDWGLQF